MAKEAMDRKADLKQGKLASESYGRVNTAVKVRLESRLNQGRLIEVEAKLIDHRERSDSVHGSGGASALEDKTNPQKAAA